MRELNRLFGKNNYPTIDDETWSRMKRSGENYRKREEWWEANQEAFVICWLGCLAGLLVLFGSVYVFRAIFPAS
jgi:hypothetical protein